MEEVMSNFDLTANISEFLAEDKEKIKFLDYLRKYQNSTEFFNFYISIYKEYDNKLNESEVGICSYCNKYHVGIMKCPFCKKSSCERCDTSNPNILSEMGVKEIYHGSEFSHLDCSKIIITLIKKIDEKCFNIDLIKKLKSREYIPYKSYKNFESNYFVISHCDICDVFYFFKSIIDKNIFCSHKTFDLRYYISGLIKKYDNGYNLKEILIRKCNLCDKLCGDLVNSYVDHFWCYFCNYTNCCSEINYKCNRCETDGVKLVVNTNYGRNKSYY